MTFLKSLFLVSVLFVSAIVNGQSMNKRHHRPLVEVERWKPNGWHFAPGLTYMWPNKIKFLGGQEDPEITPRGRLAVYLEAGRYRFFPGGGNVFNYLDYSVAYKRLSGSEEINDNKSVFKQNYLLGNFNINNIIQLSDKTFIQNSLGINGDFKFGETAPAYGANTQRLLFSLHYKFGFGFKVSERMFVIPAIETPILNAKQWEKGKSTYGLFTSRYRPLIASVRFTWLRPLGKGACPPVFTNPGDRNKQDQFQMGQ